MKKTLFAAIVFIGLTSVASAQVYSYPTTPSYIPPSYTSCPTLSHNLYRGLSDYYTQGQVTQLQNFLNARYGNQLVTGYFGSMTAANVARFQQEQGVYPVTGGVGPLTRAAIARVCGGGVTPGSNTFYLNTPFTISAGAQMKQYQGQLDFTLTRINTSPYTLYTYPGYSPVTSATITLGQACAAGTYCFYYPQQQFELTVGQSVSWQGYTVTLLSLNTNSATFTVSTSVTQNASVTVSSPTQNQTASYGQSLPINWTVQNAPANSSAVLDLYTVGGSKVGTIAIQNNTGSGSYNWTVPTPNTICTMQYPNGLCGQSLSGQYFVKVSIVSGSGFDSNPTTYASANSGTFTVQASSTSLTIAAYPTSGNAPLMVTFIPVNYSSTYAVNFGDGTSASLQQGVVTHTYATRGTYTAQFESDPLCRHQQPFCAIATMNLGSVVITVN